MGDNWDYWRDPNITEYYDMTHQAAVELVADRDALAAENARLREALRMIEDCVTDDPGSAYVVAKTALAAPKE